MIARAAVWMRAPSKVRIRPFEALAFFVPQQPSSIDHERVEADFIFTHATVTEDLDFASAHTFGRKGILLGPPAVSAPAIWKARHRSVWRDRSEPELS